MLLLLYFCFIGSLYFQTSSDFFILVAPRSVEPPPRARTPRRRGRRGMAVRLLARRIADPRSKRRARMRCRIILQLVESKCGRQNKTAVRVTIEKRTVAPCKTRCCVPPRRATRSQREERAPRCKLGARSSRGRQTNPRLHHRHLPEPRPRCHHQRRARPHQLR